MDTTFSVNVTDASTRMLHPTREMIRPSNHSISRLLLLQVPYPLWFGNGRVSQLKLVIVNMLICFQ